MKKRCSWAENDPLMQKYHDTEWGVPAHADIKHFEFLVLEGAQAGLSWKTILNRREGYRKAFADFDPKKVSQFTQKDVDRLLNDAGIIRNRLKIGSVINNAKCFLEVQKEFVSFANYIWGFVNNKPLVNRIKNIKDYKATSKESDELSKDLKKR